MDEKKKFEMTNEQRILFLNAGDGPPVGPPQNFYNSKGPITAYNIQKSSEVVYHLNSASAALDVHDNSQRIMFATPSIMVGPYLMIPAPGANLANSELQTPKEKDEQNQRLSHHPKNVQGGHNSQIDILQEQNVKLYRELALKLEELKDLKAKLSQFTERLNYPPDISAENYPDDRLIHLAATSEMGGGGCCTEKQLEDEEDLMKSAQCSELSIEHLCRNEYNAELKGAFDIGQVTEKRISSASHSSFEVIDQGFCADPEAYLEEGELKRLDNEYCVDMKQKKNFEEEILFLKSQVKTLEVRLDAGKLERVEAEAKINKKLDELSTHVFQGARSRSAENAEFLPLGIISQDCCSEMQDPRQMLSQLTAAKWKLTEQAKELKRENEELKNAVQRLESRTTTVDVQKLEEKLSRQARQLKDGESQLQAEHHRLLKAEARIRELELEHMNAGDFVIQHGTDETTIQLTTENTLLKHQIETYKEDFEVERRDREKLISEKDTLQRYRETLHNDLVNARQQLRKYEDDIASLRAADGQMRNRLRDVTEKLSGFTDATIVPFDATNDFTQKKKPSSQLLTVLMPKSSSTLAGRSADWKCRACTFTNPAQRKFCEMCGTQMDPKSSAASSVSGASNISSNWNAARPAPLLSNLRNYGDIETD